jgi:hypothetical protein
MQRLELLEPHSRRRARRRKLRLGLRQQRRGVVLDYLLPDPLGPNCCASRDGRLPKGSELVCIGRGSLRLPLRQYMKHRRKLLSYLLVSSLLSAAILGTIFLTASLSHSSPPRVVPAPPGLDRVTAVGSPVTATGDAEATLTRLGARGNLGASKAILRVLQRGGEAFYRIATSSGTDCFASSSGSTAVSVSSFDAVGCPQPALNPNSFPSAALPLLDMSMAVRSAADPDHPTLKRVEGFAADGVAAVGVMRPNGEIAARSPVDHNVYWFESLPAGELTGVVALDSAGGILFTLKNT